MRKAKQVVGQQLDVLWIQPVILLTEMVYTSCWSTLLKGFTLRRLPPFTFSKELQQWFIEDDYFTFSKKKTIPSWFVKFCRVCESISSQTKSPSTFPRQINVSVWLVCDIEVGGGHFLKGLKAVTKKTLGTFVWTDSVTFARLKMAHSTNTVCGFDWYWCPFYCACGVIVVNLIVLALHFRYYKNPILFK